MHQLMKHCSVEWNTVNRSCKIIQKKFKATWEFVQDDTISKFKFKEKPKMTS